MCYLDGVFCYAYLLNTMRKKMFSFCLLQILCLSNVSYSSDFFNCTFSCCSLASHFHRIYCFQCSRHQTKFYTILMKYILKYMTLCVHTRYFLCVQCYPISVWTSRRRKIEREKKKNVKNEQKFQMITLICVPTICILPFFVSFSVFVLCAKLTT